MKLDFYLTHGDKGGMFKAELYLNGFRPPEARVEEFPREKIVELIKNFYDELESGGIIDIEVKVRNMGLESRLYENIEKQILMQLKSRKAILN